VTGKMFPDEFAEIDEANVLQYSCELRARARII
jgi:hypothetical protein